jgi:hypothetical protein
MEIGGDGHRQADVEVEIAFRNWGAEVDSQRHRIACPLGMLHQRAQHGCGGEAAERADKAPVVWTGPAPPAAASSERPRGGIKQMLRLCQHNFLTQ